MSGRNILSTCCGTSTSERGSLQSTPTGLHVEKDGGDRQGSGVSAQTLLSLSLLLPWPRPAAAVAVEGKEEDTWKDFTE